MAVLSLIGYNGFPRGCSDDELPWARIADDELDTKYPVSDENYYENVLGYICAYFDILCVC